MSQSTHVPRHPSSGLTRREVLRLGGLPLAGLTLPRLLATEAAAQTPSAKVRPARAKSCLVIFLEGGPSHIDLWDMKPDAPAEVRGEFQPIATRNPGLWVCEHLPQFARQAHRLAFVRAVHHSITCHNAGTYYMLTGRTPVERGGQFIVGNSPKNFPPYGAVLARLRPSGRALPDFVHIPEFQSNLRVDIAGQSAGFLGAAYDPVVSGDPSLPGYHVPGLATASDLPGDRLARRDALLHQIDGALNRLGDDPVQDRMDVFRRKALQLVTAPAMRRAFDLSLEPVALGERYGTDPGTDRSLDARKFGGLPHLGQCMLLARRLIEAGVRLVTLVTGRRLDQSWDLHADSFSLFKRSVLPFFDRSCSALLEDMAERGLLDETLVVFLCEFGRTPRLGYVTSDGGAERNGRDHWPYCYTVMFAGAGVKEGAIYGASDRMGAYPARDPVTPEDVTATIYAALGIPLNTELRDPTGQRHRLALGEPIQAVLG